jgi:DNA polymerase-1
VYNITIDKQIEMKKNPTVVNYEAAVRHDMTTKAVNDLQQKLTNWRATHPKITKTEQNMVDKLNALKSGALTPYSGLNFGSPKQLEDLLYWNVNGFRFKNSEGGTGKDIIEELNDSSGFIDKLLILRGFEKIRSTYLVGLYDRLDENDKVHTSLLIHGTVSGRLSSRNPNLQNLPNIAKLKDETSVHVVNMVKKSFKCPEGYVFMQVDYSQAELRTIAEFAKEQNMLDAYNNGEDLHAKTAAAMKKISLEEFYKLDPKEQKEYRTRAKAGNFGLIYGMGLFGFIDYARKNYKIYLSEDEAREIIDTFFKLYPNLLVYHDEYIAKGLKFGYVRTLFGRKRQVPNINSSDDYIRSMDERVCVNSPIQGTAGEITIFAIAILRNRLDPRVKFELTVHDSIIFYIPEDLLEETSALIKDTCENLPMKQYFGKELSKVKMAVDLEISRTSWKDLTEYKL